MFELVFHCAAAPIMPRCPVVESMWLRRTLLGWNVVANSRVGPVVIVELPSRVRGCEFAFFVGVATPDCSTVPSIESAMSTWRVLQFQPKKNRKDIPLQHDASFEYFRLVQPELLYACVSGVGAARVRTFGGAVGQPEVPCPHRQNFGRPRKEILGPDLAEL